jgi:hypothetical protein
MLQSFRVYLHSERPCILQNNFSLHGSHTNSVFPLAAHTYNLDRRPCNTEHLDLRDAVCPHLQKSRCGVKKHSLKRENQEPKELGIKTRLQKGRPRKWLSIPCANTRFQARVDSDEKHLLATSVCSHVSAWFPLTGFP